LAVAACKRNCFSVDQIRLVIDFENGVSTEVTEGDEGYKELLLMLPKCLDSCPSEKDWWEKVAFPPFATNRTCLYRRPQ